MGVDRQLSTDHATLDVTTQHDAVIVMGRSSSHDRRSLRRRELGSALIAKLGVSRIDGFTVLAMKVGGSILRRGGCQCVDN